MTTTQSTNRRRRRPSKKTTNTSTPQVQSPGTTLPGAPTTKAKPATAPKKRVRRRKKPTTVVPTVETLSKKTTAPKKAAAKASSTSHQKSSPKKSTTNAKKKPATAKAVPARPKAASTKKATPTKVPATQPKKSTPARSPRVFKSDLALEGTLSVHPRGFGFVTIPDEEDVFVPAHILAPAYLYADDLVRVSFYGDRRTASGVTLLKRTRTRVFATIARHGNLFKAVPDPWVGATPISLKTSAVTTANLHPGAGVLVDLSAQYTLTGYGPAARPRALRQRALERFSRAQLDTQVPVETVPDLPPRTDLTGLLTFTIDGPSSRDLDDAISVMCRGPNIALYVHIADVASAVPLGSLVDERARALATSIYLPGYSLPMFPPELSYDQCSLLPGLTRRCLTIEYVVSPDGEIVSTDLYHSLILSNTRLSYEEAARALDGTTLLASGLQVALELTHEATTALGCARARRGGLATERTEATYDLVVDGDSLSLASSDNAAVAHALIEEAMVAANEAVANWLRDRHLPGVFRTHPTPGPAASAAVEFFAKNLGITVDPDTELTPKVLALLETQLDELPEPTIPLWSVISPHLERAIYQPTPDTHFGLASSAYVHFTSPIRRYADLTVHRIITASLTGTSYDEDLTALCEHINKAAGYAARTEIAARALLWAAYLQSLPAGAKKSMKARIVKIADKGIVVALNEYGASGWILSRALDRGGIVADEHFHRTVGASGTTWALNDPITVAIDEIDTDSGIITFALVK